MTDSTSGDVLRAAVANAAFRNRARAMAADPISVLDLAHDGGAGSAPLDMLAAMTPDLQRRLRAGAQALERDYRLQTSVTFELAVELARALNAREWPGAASDFLAVVRAEEPEDETPFDGDDFDDADWDFEDDEPDAESSSRLLGTLSIGELAEPDPELIAAHELLIRIVTEQRQPTAEERTILDAANADMDFAGEDGRELLPAGGHLAFFAALADEAEFYEPIEPGGPGRDRVAVVHAAAGEPSHEPSPPHAPVRDEYDVPVVLRERRVRPTARLQIRHMGFGYATRLYGLDAIADTCSSASHGRSTVPSTTSCSAIQPSCRKTPEKATRSRCFTSATTESSGSSSSTAATCSSSDPRTPSAPVPGNSSRFGRRAAEWDASARRPDRAAPSSRRPGGRAVRLARSCRLLDPLRKHVVEEKDGKSEGKQRHRMANAPGETQLAGATSGVLPPARNERRHGGEVIRVGRMT